MEHSFDPAPAGPGGCGPHRIVIVGAGATGVELAAELHRTTREVVSYGLDRIDPDRHIRLHLIEAADRVLPALAPRLSQATARMLQALGVELHTSARVAQVGPDEVGLADGRRIAAELVVWAAGVKAPAVLSGLAGLESNRIHQLLVRPTLQTTRDDHVFALGDCAACPWPTAPGQGGWVPPRAQAAQQQALHMVGQIRRWLAGQPLRDFHYRDFGSLVSLGHQGALGDLLGGLCRGGLMVEGRLARALYQSLYKRHELGLHGWPKVALATVVRWISGHTGPRVKLH